jgi:hypothetical protein
VIFMKIEKKLYASIVMIGGKYDLCFLFFLLGA